MDVTAQLNGMLALTISAGIARLSLNSFGLLRIEPLRSHNEGCGSVEHSFSAKVPIICRSLRSVNWRRGSACGSWPARLAASLQLRPASAYSKQWRRVLRRLTPSLLPSGNFERSQPEYAADAILLPKLVKLLPKYPDIKVEIILDYGLTNIDSTV